MVEAFRRIKGNERAQQLSFARTLIWDFYGEERFEPEEKLALALGAFGTLSERLLSSSVDTLLGEFAKRFRSFSAGASWSDLDRVWVRSIAEVMIGRRFFVGSGSDVFPAPIGLASAKLNEGDLICILFGCPLPVILHEVDSAEKFVLVGLAYLDGFMYGEAFKILENDPASGVRSWDIT